MICFFLSFAFIFFFNDTATTEIYTLSLHDALPISVGDEEEARGFALETDPVLERAVVVAEVLASRRAGSTHDHADRKSTRLNSSHQIISYAVFCLKKKKKKRKPADTHEQRV